MPSERISLLVPTRGRPRGMQIFYDSVIATATEPPEIVYYLDEDDYCYCSMPEAERQRALGGVKLIIGPRIVLSECWNRCAEQATGEILMHAGDDLIFRTPRWDEIVLEAFAKFPDRIVFVHGDDGSPQRGRWNGKVFGTHGFLHRRWIETVGYFVPPYFSCDYNDSWLNEVANELGRRVVVPIVTDHMHPMWGKGQWDTTHLERVARGKRDRVAALYARHADDRKADIAKLGAAIRAYAEEHASA